MTLEENHKIHTMDMLVNCENILIVQDIDGVCIPLVSNPLKRKITS